MAQIWYFPPSISNRGRLVEGDQRQKAEVACLTFFSGMSQLSTTAMTFETTSVMIILNMVQV